MCGIVGCIYKKEPVLDFLIEGLERLEYRGYDSSGVAVIEKGALFTSKQEGKLNQLKKALKGENCSSFIGIGHTRWATHGRPSQANSHPHTDIDNEIAIVHNGIIENFQELKSELIEQGVQFSSETDSEVLAHLIHNQSQAGKIPLEEAVRLSLKKAKGAYAIAVISSRDPEKLVGARLGSPLIVGIGKNGNYLASDVPAILKQTNKVIYPNDGEIILLTADSYKVFDLDKKSVKHKVHTIEWTLDQVTKNGYDKFMLKEIHEQPKVIEAILKQRNPKGEQISFEELNIDEAVLKGIERISIVSCGTAYHAGFFIKYFLENNTDLPVDIDVASEFRYRKPKLNSKILVLTISQSGETADTLASLRLAKSKGCQILSIVNVMGSTIDRESDGVIYTHAGPEIGVASTKAYTAQMTCGLLFALYLAQLRKEMDSKSIKAMLKEAHKLPEMIQTVLKQEKHIAEIASQHAYAESALYLGRGFNFPSALEGALKNKEISYMHAEGHAAGEMKHGPIALIDHKLPVFCICPDGDSYEKMVSNVKEVEARKGLIISILTEGDKNLESISKETIFIPKIKEDLTPLLVAIPLQLLAFYIAETKGCDIDQPRNLAKSVTVE